MKFTALIGLIATVGTLQAAQVRSGAGATDGLSTTPGLSPRSAISLGNSGGANRGNAGGGVIIGGNMRPDTVLPPLPPPGVALTPGGGVIVYSNPRYIILPKAATRAAIAQRQALLRAQQQRAQAQARAAAEKAQRDADHDIDRASTQTDDALAPQQVQPSTRVFPPLSTPAQAYPYVRRIYAPAPVAPAPESNLTPKPEAPREPSVYVSSGPLFGEVDPLVEYQKEQAARGNSQSQYALGLRYLAGNGVEQDEQLGIEWLEKAAKGGELRASRKLRELARN